MRIYLDHAATTPIRPEAAAAMAEGFGIWANPSSPHGQGRAARAALEAARERVKAAMGWEGELIFTSGASEALSMGLSHAKAGARLVSAVEHESVLNAAPDARIIRVRSDGLVDDEALSDLLAQAPAPLIAVQSVNSETGIAQDVGAIADLARHAGGLMLCDASQSAGKMPPLPYEHAPDMVVVSAHKFGGPVGIGALLVKDFAMLAPSGGQERGYRRGTENLPGAMGMAAALETCSQPYLREEVREALASFEGEVLAMAGAWIGDASGHVHAIAMPGMSAKAQLMQFDMAGIAVSQGSACSSGTMKRSHVLEAMGIPAELADRVIRVSAGWTTTRQEIERFAECWIGLARKKHAA